MTITKTETKIGTFYTSDNFIELKLEYLAQAKKGEVGKPGDTDAPRVILNKESGKLEYQFYSLSINKASAHMTNYNLQRSSIDSYIVELTLTNNEMLDSQNYFNFLSNSGITRVSHNSINKTITISGSAVDVEKYFLILLEENLISNDVYRNFQQDINAHKTSVINISTDKNLSILNTQNKTKYYIGTDFPLSPFLDNFCSTMNRGPYNLLNLLTHVIEYYYEYEIWLTDYEYSFLLEVFSNMNIPVSPAIHMLTK